MDGSESCLCCQRICFSSPCWTISSATKGTVPLRLWFVSSWVVVPSHEVVVTENSLELSCRKDGVRQIFGSDIDAVDSVDQEMVVT